MVAEVSEAEDEADVSVVEVSLALVVASVVAAVVVSDVSVVDSEVAEVSVSVTAVVDSLVSAVVVASKTLVISEDSVAVGFVVHDISENAKTTQIKRTVNFLNLCISLNSS